MNWNALLAMLALIGVAIWLVAGSDGESGPVELRDGASVVDVRIGTMRGQLERLAEDDTFRVLFPDRGDAPEILTRAEVERLLGSEVVAGLFEAPTNWMFRIFNITSWSSLVWIGIGLAGQIAFFLRMFVQWVVSERRRESVVPEIFWWLSFGGGVALFSYFVWRKDLIGALGQTTGVVVYARNLRLIHKRRKLLAAGEVAA